MVSCFALILTHSILSYKGTNGRNRRVVVCVMVKNFGMHAAGGLFIIDHRFAPGNYHSCKRPKLAVSFYRSDKQMSTSWKTSKTTVGVADMVVM